MKRTLALGFLFNLTMLAAANPFLGKWDCTEVGDIRLNMTFRHDMKVRIERKQEHDVKEVSYEVSQDNPRITINGMSFTYLFTDDNHFILYPDMSEFITSDASREIIRSLLLEMFRSHHLYTGRRVQ